MQQRAKDSRIWKFLKLRKSSDPGKTSSESWERDSLYADDVTSGREETHPQQERGRSRSRDRAARAVDATMKSAIQRSQSASPHRSDGSSNRGCTPSPKRNPAPQPPTPERCPSPAPKLVSTSDVLPGDQQGWLTDQLRGRKVWCAVADMLFCVFEKEDSKVSKQVLLLPGCKVRQVEFKTAVRDNGLVNGVGRRFKSKTISGVDKFQFWIENSTNCQRLIFGVDSKAELEQWMEVLTRVASVDPDTITTVGRAHKNGSRREGRGDNEPMKGETEHEHDGENGHEDRGTAHARLSSTSSTSGDVTSGYCEGIPMGSSYTPSQTLPRRIDFLSMSLSNTGDVGKGSVDNIRKRLRREHEQTQDGKMAPLKATYTESDTTLSADTRSGMRSFFRVGALESLFKGKKRSSSADDAMRRKSVKDVTPKHFSSSPPSLEQTRRAKPALARSGSEGLMRVEEGKLSKQDRAFLSRSWDGEKQSRGLGASIRRSASDLKSRLFSHSAKSRCPGLRLGDLTDARLQGFLQYKTTKWMRIWAVLCRGCFYGFKSDKADEVPLLVFVLPQCSVQYMQQTDRRHKKLFTFQLIQPHSRSLNLSAENYQDLMKWMQALQMELCKVVDEDDTSSIELDNISNTSADGTATKSTAFTGNLVKVSASFSIVQSASPTSASREDSKEQFKPSTLRSSVTSDSSGQFYSAWSDSGLASASSSTLHSPDDVVSDRPLASHASGSVSSNFPGYRLDERSQLEIGSEKERTSQVHQKLPVGHDAQLDQLVLRAAARGNQWSLPDSPRDRSDSQDDDNNLDTGSFHSDADNASSCGSSASQPNTPRHDDALTQVWGRDKGYLLQLIRNKLLRRKRKAFNSLMEGKTIYNKELARSHEGGLLIQHDDSDQASVDSGQEVLLGDSRQRSRSFTEGKTSRAPPPPAGNLQPHLPARGWRSSPSTPRDSHHDFTADVTRRQRFHPRQRTIESSDVTVSHPPSDDLIETDPRDVVDEVYDNYVSSDTTKRYVVVRTQLADNDRNNGANESFSNGNRTALHQSHVTNSSVTSSTQHHVASPRRKFSGNVSRYGFRYSNATGSRDENGNSNTDSGSNRPHKGGGVYLPVERGRSYSAAWDEEDNEHSVPKGDTFHTNDDYSQNHSVNKSVREKADISVTQQTASASQNEVTSESQTVRVQSIPRGRPRQLPVRSQASSRDKDPSQVSPQTPVTPTKPPQLPVPEQSSGIPQRAKDPDRQLRRSPRALGGGPPSPRDSSALLQSPKSPSSGPPQNPRGPQSPRGGSSGPPQNLRETSSGPPQSPRSPSGPQQHPRSSSLGPLQSPRSSSAGPPQSPRGPPQSPRRGAPGIPQSPLGSSTTSKPGGGGGVDVGKEGTRGRGRRPTPMAVMQLAARDLQSPAMHGYLHRKTFNDQWPRYWYVLQDGCLYCYLTPDDRVTVDVTDLDGYTVTSLEDKFPGQRFVIHLDHEDYIPVYLSASSREEMEEWDTALTSAIQATPRSNGLDPQEDDPAGARGGRVAEERVLSVKQKLLAEVLRQKQELEMKQAARLANKKQHSVDDSELVMPPSTPPTPTGEQICTLTRLRQRRMSTQIKMDTLQRQIQTNGHKKSRFHFGKKKGDDTLATHNSDIVEQLRMLSDDLSEIDRDLVQNGAITLDRAHAHRKLQMPGLRHSYDLESSTIPEGGKTRANGLDGVLNEESGITRSNSLKSSMQKFAHRTFARAGWRGKKSSNSESVDKDDATDDRAPSSAGSHYHVTTDAPDVIDLSHRLMRTWLARDSSVESGGDEQSGCSETLTFLPPPSSFNGDDASPVPSPRSPRSTGSVSDQGHHHCNASHPHRHHDDYHTNSLKSPRRQVDPHAMANIEAFEELSRQILGEKAS